MSEASGREHWLWPLYRKHECDNHTHGRIVSSRQRRTHRVPLLLLHARKRIDKMPSSLAFTRGSRCLAALLPANGHVRDVKGAGCAEDAGETDRLE